MQINVNYMQLSMASSMVGVWGVGELMGLSFLYRLSDSIRPRSYPLEGQCPEALW